MISATRTIEAHSAEEALSKLESGVEIDVVITDHAMPVMTGLQLAARIQERYPGLPIILATGYAELPSEPAAMGLLKLAKPCTQHDIAVGYPSSHALPAWPPKARGGGPSPGLDTRCRCNRCSG